MQDAPKRDSDQSLPIRAAWLHHAGGMTPSEVAKRLRVTRVKAHRLIFPANHDRAVKIVTDGEIAECVALETDLSRRYGLEYGEVVANQTDNPIPVRVLGLARAACVTRAVEDKQARLIGADHGRTLAASVSMMAQVSAKGVPFVSLLGCLTRNLAANSHDTIHRLAEKTGADAFVMPVPFFANSEKDRAVILSQHCICEVLEPAARSHLKTVSIETAEAESSLVATGTIQTGEIGDIKRAGGVGEILGHFFDANGGALATALTRRMLSLRLDAVQGSKIVAIAGGEIKAAAIRSVPRSGLLFGLITDERTALALAHDNPA